VGAIEPVGSHLARLLPNAGDHTLRRLEGAVKQQAFRRRDLLHARGMPLPPFVLLDGHVMFRRVVETGQVRAALIAGPGYLGGLRSISDPDADALYELVALTDGIWTTWDPRYLRDLALQDAGLAIGLLDLASDDAVVLNMRLDERSFANARQRMASILLRYGGVIFDTPHPVAHRADLAAMIGAGRVMMYRTLLGLEADGLVKRERGGGIRVLDEEGWLRTGDVARLDEEGYVYIVDRAKDMVIRGGENVYSVEVEAAIYEHPAVVDVAVIGVPHEVLGEEVGAVVVLRPGAKLEADALREFLAGRIAAFKIPAHVWFHDEPLPRNPAGKVLKRELREDVLVES